MLIKIRKRQAHNQTFRECKMGNSSSNFFEWQPQGTDRWYTIHRRNIMTGNHPSHEKYLLINQFFNTLIAGLVCEIHGVYRRDTKTLELVM